MIGDKERRLLLVTFGFGFFLGVYLYLTGFATTYERDTTPDRGGDISFAIEGEYYGGCQRAGTCAAFRLENDGTYRYIEAASFGATPEVITGSLERETLRQVKAALDADTLITYSQSVENANCASYVDGIDVRYTVTIQNTEYRLDSCTTALPKASSVRNVLDDLFRSLAP